MIDVEPAIVRAHHRAQQQATALARPMTHIPLAGDPRLARNADGLLKHPEERLLCLYAAALMQQRGLLPADASRIDAAFQPPATVVFIRADQSQDEVCRFTLWWLA